MSGEVWTFPARDVLGKQYGPLHRVLVREVGHERAESMLQEAADEIMDEVFSNSMKTSYIIEPDPKWTESIWQHNAMYEKLMQTSADNEAEARNTKRFVIVAAFVFFSIIIYCFLMVHK